MAVGLLLDLRLLLLFCDVGTAQSRRVESDNWPGFPFKQIVEALQAVVDGRHLFLYGFALFHGSSTLLGLLSSLSQRLVVPIINEAVFEVAIVVGSASIDAAHLHVAVRRWTAALPLPPGRRSMLEQCSCV